MITTKQRAKLRGLANPMDTILQIGKSGIIGTTITQVDEALSARELIKLRCLETSPVTAKEAAATLAENLEADIVQVIGTRFVLFRRNKKAPQIEL
ncbi:MAG: YhbY family RNA-binding protein [Oscillospiraceae bacterium]|nr:YhbY family RNA-binding protein [Oscillospiraceae bacterium]